MKSLRSVSVIILFAVLLCWVSGVSANTINLLTDIEVAYLYENAGDIDWPLIYYLTEENGCTVELATVNSGPMFRHLLRQSEEFNLNSSIILINDTSAIYLDSVVNVVSSGEIPDIVIFAGDFENPYMKAVENHLLNMKIDTSRVYLVRRFYRRIADSEGGSVYLKSKQYWENMYEDISKMAEAVDLRTPLRDFDNIYSIYDLIKSNDGGSDRQPSFLGGINRFKFNQIIERNIESAVQREALRINRKNYVSKINEAIKNQGRDRIELLLQAMQEAKKIRQTYYYQIGRVDSTTDVARYIEKTISSITRAIFYEARVDYHGNMSICETPEGRKLKFRADINNNGYVPVRAGKLDFRAAWMDEPVTIDSAWAEILPNNSLIREYSVDIPAGHLDDISESTMQFIGHVRYAGKDVEFKYSARTYEKTGFSAELVPDFLIIKPFPKLQIDRLVEPAYLKAIITKPNEYAGEVDVEIVTPSSIYVGAYSKKLQLQSGETAVEMKIPLAITRSIGDQRHEVIINVTDNDRRLASDLAYVGECPYDIPAELNIAILADQNGLLEDLLIQSDAAYKSLSLRYLKAGELDYYDAVIIGPGPLDDPQLPQLLKDKLKKYLELGGTVITFNRPGKWGGNILPVSIITDDYEVPSGDLKVKTANHPIFKEKYKINLPDLLKRSAEKYIPRPAVVFPAEKIIESGEGTVVLSETKIGEGKLIYCGLPLLDMIRDLDTEAIRLFTNLVVYSGN